MTGRDRKTPIRVINQGTPRLSHETGHLVRGDNDVVCFYVDLVQKYCEGVSSSYTKEGFPEITFGTSEETPDYHYNDNLTDICFPEFKGWNVFAFKIQKYTIAIVLTNESKEKVE